jgi:hypothetical protein
VNDLRIVRERQIAASTTLDAMDDLDAYSSPAMVVQTMTISVYPTSPSVFYGCNPVQITGTETEGSTPTLTADGSTVLYCLNLGTQIPTAGSYVVAHVAGGRWVFRFDG